MMDWSVAARMPRRGIHVFAHAVPCRFDLGCRVARSRRRTDSLADQARGNEALGELSAFTLELKTLNVSTLPVYAVRERIQVTVPNQCM